MAAALSLIAIAVGFVKAIPPPSGCRRRRGRISCRGGGERKHTVGGRIRVLNLHEPGVAVKAIFGNRPRPADAKEPITLAGQWRMMLGQT